MNLKYFSLLLIFTALDISADNSALNAAVGGAIGGAAGAALGNELGGRNGAIVGGAVGASVGTAITTDHDHRNSAPVKNQYNNPLHNAYPVYPGNIYLRNQIPGFHCPPGQAKKGRC